jgi:hypothetical protein
METGIRSLTSTDLRVTTSTNQETLGAVGSTADGRLFRYVQADASAGLAIGKLGVAPAVVANHVNRSLASTSNTAVGSNVVTVSVGATACAANQYAGGYLVVRDGAGAGAAYRIDGNSYSAGSGSVVVTLFDTIQTALSTSTSKVDLVNPFAGVAASTTLSQPVGVATVELAAGYFGWVQTKGIASVLIDGTPGKGDAVIQSDAVAGAVEVAGSTTQQIGVMPEAGVDTKYNQVALNIA